MAKIGPLIGLQMERDLSSRWVRTRTKGLILLLVLILFQTTKSYLVLASLHQKPDETPYVDPRLSPSTLRTLLSGPGEALPLQALVIRFEGVIRVEGCLLRYDLGCFFDTTAYPFTFCTVYLHENITSSSRPGTHHLSSA